jgi:hypothetical protein
MMQLNLQLNLPQKKLQMMQLNLRLIELPKLRLIVLPKLRLIVLPKLLLVKPLELLLVMRLELLPVEPLVMPLAELPDLPFVEWFVELPLQLHKSYLHKQGKPLVTKFSLHHFELLRV